jgi:CTD small phosphatase-like protein 2
MDPSVDIKQCSEEEVATLQEDPSSEGEDEDEEDEFNPYLFIKSLPRYEAVQHLRPPVALPPKDPSDPPITLVLDLDETLVHCSVETTEESDLTFPVVFHGMEYQVHVKLRPYVFEFLEKVHDKFEVVVFTASQKVYADELLDRLDPSKYFRYTRVKNAATSNQ